MIEVHHNLFVGTDADCFYDEKEGYAVIHACKDPCHKNKLGYKGSLPPSHPNYLIFEDGNHLYLNIVDMDSILSEFADPMFLKALEFIDKNISDKKILVHCNLGLSRSPAIALIYLAKSGIISNDSYKTAESAFLQIYPSYSPGIGIRNYLLSNWEMLVNK